LHRVYDALKLMGFSLSQTTDKQVIQFNTPITKKHVFYIPNNKMPQDEVQMFYTSFVN